MQIALERRVMQGRPAVTEEEQYVVRQVKIALNRLGFYTPDPHTGMTGDVDEGFKDAVYAFQRKATIYFDDVDIGPGSTTERILNKELAAQDDGAFYIWRTVGDGKVRGEHAARAGMRFSWSNPPDGENPGEDYNCRCWAEPVVAPWHPWIEWVNKRKEARFSQSSAVEKLAPPKDVKDEITDLMTQVPVDAINSTVSPLDFVGWGAVPTVKLANRAIVAEIIKRQLAREAAKRDVSWVLGSKKSAVKWTNQMRDRNWTDEKITGTIKFGEKHPAPNDVNKGNEAIRYEYEGTYLVRDEKTKEIIHLGDKYFKRPIKR